MAEIRRERNEISLRLEGPLKASWYHGRIDRKTAEKILRACGNGGGSFLVRESAGSAGAYVLSYLGNQGSQISHFRITALCGEFYIGGLQFSKLFDLVAYYMHYSQLVNGEKLVHPIPPDKEVNDTRYVRSIFPYHDTELDSDELSFDRGDLFSVSNELGEGWLWAVNEQTGKSGTIYKDFVIDVLKEGEENIESLSYFHAQISSSEIKEHLVKAGEHSYLIKPDEDSSTLDYTLYLLHNKSIRRFRIQRHGRGYLIGNRPFESISQIVQKYSSIEILAGATLKHPVEGSDAPDSVKTPHSGNSAPNSVYQMMRQSSRTGVDILTSRRHANYKVLLSEELYVRKGKKPTRSMYTVLQSDGQLLMTENRRRTKPDILIDLNHTAVYPADSSLMLPLPAQSPVTNPASCTSGERTVIQLVTGTSSSSQTVYYISADSPEMVKDWIKSLKPFSKNTKHVTMETKSSAGPALNQHRSLTVGLPELKNLPDRMAAMTVCCQISATDSTGTTFIIARTQYKDATQAIFDETFHIDDLPDDLLSCTVTILCKNKKSSVTKESDCYTFSRSLQSDNLSALTLPDPIWMTDLPDEWVTLTPTSGAPSNSTLPSLRLSIEYSRELSLSLNEYADLRKVLINRDGQTVVALASLSEQSSYRIHLAQSLLKIFRRENCHIALLKRLNAVEVAREDDPATLFRRTTLATTLMDQYMKSVAGQFITAALKATVDKVIENSVQIDLDPHIAGRNGITETANGDLETNQRNLLQLLNESLINIIKAKNQCPLLLRHVCHCLQLNVANKWPDSEIVKPRVVSGFIFLRLLCPALVNPRSFNLCSDTPSPQPLKTLKLIAKSLQNLANLIEVGNKECHMEAIGPFIVDNKPKMVTFLNELSDCPKMPDINTDTVKYHQPPSPSTIDQPDVPNTELARVYASLYHICITHIKTLQERSKQQHALKKLVAAIRSIEDVLNSKYL